MKPSRRFALLAVLFVLLLLMFGGLWMLRSTPPAITPTPKAALTLPPPTPERFHYQAANQAFEVDLPPQWRLAQQGDGWWWFVEVGLPADAEGQPIPPTPRPRPLRPTPPPQATDAPRDDPFAPAENLDVAAIGISYAPLGDPQRDPEDAVYRWFVEVEPWLPWALPEDQGEDDPEAEYALWQQLRTRSVGDSAYPAAEADFQWETAQGPVQARLVLVKVYGQVWAFFAYAFPDEWPRVEEALETALATFRPAPDPPPAEGETHES